MILVLALLAQTAGLEADDSKAALTCLGAARPANRIGMPPLRSASQATYYLLQSVAAPGREQFMQRLSQAARTGAADVSHTPEATSAILAACEQRFPKVRVEGPVALPADAFDRDLMCLAELNLFGGAASRHNEETGDRTQLDRAFGLLAKYRARLTPGRYAANGLPDAAAQERAFGDQMVAALELGPPDAIVASCETAAAS
ncbi:MAG: hypothetical protein V4574_07035 [Pseudomonadota bacterium]